MSTKPASDHNKPSRDEGNWATPVARLSRSELSPDALAINIEGRRVMSPLQGFGQLWQKTYLVRLAGAKVSPKELMAEWKTHFPTFWPKGNRFYAPLIGIKPGETAALSVSTPGGVRLSTGVLVLYADDESFTFMTPEGHMFSGWVTFSSHESEGATVAQVQMLIRSSDPLYEIGFRIFGSKREDRFWQSVLESLSNHFDVRAEVQLTATCVDTRVQWSRAWNVWHNAFIRSIIHAATFPARWIVRPLTR